MLFLFFWHGNPDFTGGNDGDEESPDLSPVVIDVSRSAILANARQALPTAGNRCSPETSSILESEYPPLPQKSDVTYPSSPVAYESSVTLTDLSDDDLTFTNAIESQDSMSNVSNLPTSNLGHGENEQSFDSTVNLSPPSTTLNKENLCR